MRLYDMQKIEFVEKALKSFKKCTCGYKAKFHTHFLAAYADNRSLGIGYDHPLKNMRKRKFI